MGSLISFIFFTLAVAMYSYYRTHKGNQDTTQTASSYFMAGGQLTCWVICGSMLLANLSAEHLIGLNGAAYRSNLSIMAWEVSAGTTAALMACYLLPRYLRGGFTTTPQFLQERYDVGVKRMVSGVFATAYIAILIPMTLYLGAIAFNKAFLIDHTDLIQSLTKYLMDSGWLTGDLDKLAYNVSIVCLIWSIALIASLYSTLGGLKLAVVANSLNALGLLIAGVSVLVLGLIALGDGSILGGVSVLVKENPEKLSAIGDGKNGTIPFGGVFTGVMVGSMYYWATGQVIVQRCLAAKNLAEAQKGVLLTGVFKMFGPLIMMIPGVIAFHYYKENPLPAGLSDLAYPSLIRDLLPGWMTGFFMAALFGSVLSVVNSLMGSATTLICIDFIKPLKPSISDHQLVNSGKYVGVVLTIVCMCLAPLLLSSPEGIFVFARRFVGFFNVPVLAAFSLGFLTKKVPPIAAKLAIVFNIVTYGLLIFVFKIESPESMLNQWVTHLLGGDVTIHFLYVIFWLFVFEVSAMLLIGYFFPMKKIYVEKKLPYSERFEEWRYTRPCSVFLLAIFAFIYVTLSPIGVASDQALGSFYWGIVALIFGVASVIAYFVLPSKKVSPRLV
jgi:SSS family solute:Na+ symporter